MAAPAPMAAPAAPAGAQAHPAGRPTTALIILFVLLLLAAVGLIVYVVLHR
ncbi:MAG TPA: hypothetical protein VH157_08725 [Bryobacteraceae bacterium]|nr:hypothetical protein [Bryobacteraceae bacterium]